MTDLQPQELQSKPGPKFWILGAIIITGLLWCSSFALPVWDTRSDHTGDWDAVPGIVPGLMGWLGIFAYCPAWFANILLIPLCMAFFKWRKAGFPLSLVALGLAASAYIMPGIYGDADEAVIEGRRIGFYVWLGSFLVMVLAHALLSPPTRGSWIAARLAVVALMVLCIADLERICPVGVSPLETALKDPKDPTALTAALARNPSQADKDATLKWALRQNLSDNRDVPSKQVAMLLAAGANVNQTNEYGDTLLMDVVPPLGSEALVELFVKAGADVNVRDSRGKTALDITREWNRSPECEKFLINAGAKPGGK